jgi:hypothetical protein
VPVAEALGLGQPFAGDGVVDLFVHDAVQRFQGSPFRDGADRTPGLLKRVEQLKVREEFRWGFAVTAAHVLILSS